MPKSQTSASACRLVLNPDVVMATSLERTFAAREALFAWLDATVSPQQTADLIHLNRLYYESARAKFGLPAQMTVLALRDWVRRRRGEPVDGIALDDKLFSVRSLSVASIATVDGRYQFPFHMAGYVTDWRGGAAARLLWLAEGFEVQAVTGAAIPKEEHRMATEGIVGRIGRLIAGMAHGAVGTAERANPKTVLEQAIREIDAAAEEVRVDLGRKTAERHRVDARRKELAGELGELDRTIALAVKQDRDDLASAGIERQLDIEAQIGVLDALLKDVDESITQFHVTLDAVRASRREAESRLGDIDRSTEASRNAWSEGRAGGSAAARVERAEAAVERVTGVPAGLSQPNPAVKDLRQLARDHAIKERLARFKDGR